MSLAPQKAKLLNCYQILTMSQIKNYVGVIDSKFIHTHSMSPWLIRFFCFGDALRLDKIDTIVITVSIPTKSTGWKQSWSYFENFSIIGK